MSGKFMVNFVYFSCILLTSIIQTVHNTPMYSYSAVPDSTKYGANKQVVVAAVDKPLDAVLEAVMEFGGNILLLVPQREFEKRDPPGPDLGTGRSYSGQRTAKVLWGQLASSSPTGPGRRKRNSTDGEGAASSYSFADDDFGAIVKRGEEIYPR